MLHCALYNYICLWLEGRVGFTCWLHFPEHIFHIRVSEKISGKLKQWGTDVMLKCVQEHAQRIGDHPLWPCPSRVVRNYVRHLSMLINNNRAWVYSAVVFQVFFRFKHIDTCPGRLKIHAENWGYPKFDGVSLVHFDIIIIILPTGNCHVTDVYSLPDFQTHSQKNRSFCFLSLWTLWPLWWALQT